jgi:hypothetical protein
MFSTSNFEIVLTPTLTTHELVAFSSAALEIAHTKIIGHLGIRDAVIKEEIDTLYPANIGFCSPGLIR